MRRGAVIANAVAFQASWFVVILGAARGLPWLGVAWVAVVAGVNLALRGEKGRFAALLAACAALGYAADSILVLGGVLAFPDPARLGGPSTLWMVALWVNLACTLDASLAWLRGRHVVAIVFGFLGGAGSYVAGARLGAVDWPRGEVAGAVAAGVLWAVVMPLLMVLAGRILPAPPAPPEAPA